jgi:hypothetical protein
MRVGLLIARRIEIARSDCGAILFPVISNLLLGDSRAIWRVNNRAFFETTFPRANANFGKEAILRRKRRC